MKIDTTKNTTPVESPKINFRGEIPPGNSKAGMRRTRKINPTSPRGQSMIELALLLPILLVLIISALEFGRVFFAKIVITNAAREGAYYLTTHPSDYNPGSGSAPKSALAAEVEAGNSGIPAITVAFTPQNCCTQGVYSMIVTVETNVENVFILGFLANTLSITPTHDGNFPISASVEMMMQ